MSTEHSSTMRDELVDCLSQQLSEIELLKAMYPNHGDIIISTKSLTEISNFIESPSEYIPNNLDFVLNLFINAIKLEVFINLPMSYPIEEPDIYIRCNQLNRQQETSLNTELNEYIRNNYVGDVCLYTAITWLQENFETFSTIQIAETKPVNEVGELGQKENKFSRVWIYSHHIYNKKKREEIQKKAKELNLTGFCLPGKPGVICIEGDDVACNEWWRDIKSMCWKKIVIRKQETFDISEVSAQRKFYNFEELHFKTIVNSKHANMSEFSKYMSDHGFSQVFNDFFGLCNE